MRENQKGPSPIGSFDALHSQAVAALSSGRLADAEHLSQKALEIRPNDVGTLNVLGQALLNQRRPAEAAEVFIRTLQLSPRQPNLHYNLSLAYQAIGRLDQAIASIQQAIELDPSVPVLHAKLGQFLSQGNAASDAVPVLRHALILDPKSISIRLNLAQALTDLGELSESEELSRAALFLSPNDPNANRMLGRIHQIRGEFDKAIPFFEKSIARQPAQAAAYFALSYSRKAQESDQQLVQTMERLVDQPMVPEVDRSLLCYALGKSLDDVGHPERASNYFRRANEIMLKSLATSGRTFHLSDEQRRTENIIKHFSADTIRSGALNASYSSRPIFIVGMIRSGTTLVEQVLSRHPDIAAAGELRFWLESGPEFTDHWSQIGGKPDVAEIAERYLHELNRISSDSQFVTDKMPLNFFGLGLIHLAFPNAKFIHLRRNPLDTCLSVYLTPFRNSPPFGHRLENIAAAYQEYQRLMDHWHEVIPTERLLDVDYEILATDPEPTIRKMTEFCGIEWSDALLKPNDTVRTVQTPSQWQVRQPFYQNSIGRWERYRELLAPILPLFDGS